MPRSRPGIVVVGLAVLILGLLIGLDSIVMFFATLAVGLAVIALWGLSYFGRSTDE